MWTMTSPETCANTKRERAIEFCEMTREQRKRTDRSTRAIVTAALAAGLAQIEVAEHAGLTVEQVVTYQGGEQNIGSR